MVFSSPVFLFLFLPCVLLLYFGLRTSLRNLVLLGSSLFFYAWGETYLVLLMVLSIIVNWGLGLWIGSTEAPPRRRVGLALGVVFNLGLLVAFKYADWLWTVASSALVAAGILDDRPAALGSLLGGEAARGVLLTEQGGIRLPIGVSFFTFQAMSYVVDVYRGSVERQKSLLNFATYLSLFPQLIAGPIVRYHDVAKEIESRTVRLEGFSLGARRFVIGLGKKMLIANSVALVADQIFAIPAVQLTPALAWIGIVAYALQIYFDFSGYSDMAIGLGHMFGFRFLENFNYPYISRSITEFWRRWHISLSTWFRDYLYIPLGGSRQGAARTYRNLVIVFFLCGLWHGASFAFVVWGLYHGLFLVLERMGLSTWMGRRPAPLQHAYTLLVVLVGWVFFRAESLSGALWYLQTMFGLGAGDPALHPVAIYADRVFVLAVVAGVLGSMPWLPRVRAWSHEHARGPWRVGLEVATVLGFAAILLGSVFELSAGVYNPFIYFRF
jgi:alginate O-acetyltransferase complex protein AlgI